MIFTIAGPVGLAVLALALLVSLAGVRQLRHGTVAGGLTADETIVVVLTPVAVAANLPVSSFLLASVVRERQPVLAAVCLAIVGLPVLVTALTGVRARRRGYGPLVIWRRGGDLGIIAGLSVDALFTILVVGLFVIAAAHWT